MARARTKDVLLLAALSRLFLFFLMAIWRLLGRHYDTSALLNPPCLGPSSSSQDLLPPLFPKVGEFLEKFIVWDGVYYIRIAECGYEFEQTFAFLPVLPLCIRMLSLSVLSGLIPLVGFRATLFVSGFLLNNAVFMLSALYLYRLSYMVLKNEILAYQSAALFCLNPASIFYASLYSESMFSLLTFAGLLLFVRGSQWKSACLFAISGGIRSNGIVHGGFFLFRAVQESCKLCHQRRLKMAVQIMAFAFLQMALVFGPFAMFQAFGYMMLCLKKTNDEEVVYSRPWCTEKIPYLYGFVQSNYWNVGFLRYFHFKQLPNFLLAFPMLSLSVGSIIYYIWHRPKLFFTLGLCLDRATPASIIPEDKEIIKTKSKGLEPLIFNNSNLKQRGRKFFDGNAQCDGALFDNAMTHSIPDLDNFNEEESFLSSLSIPFLMEMGFMTFVACFIMHAQVATRFLSICPPVYWFAAHITHSLPNRQVLSYLVWGTFIFYVLLGSLLFVNFYPFT